MSVDPSLTDPPRSLLFHSGPVRVTADRVEEAIAISDGRVDAIGSLANVADERRQYLSHAWRGDRFEDDE